MALDNPERVALHQDLVDGLGRRTADRLMAQLPQVDWSQLTTKDDLRRVDERFDLIDKQFKLVHDEIRFVTEQFEHVDHQFKHVHELLGSFEPMIEGKVDSIVRRHFFALLGLLVGFAAATAAVVAMTFAMISAD